MTCRLLNDFESCSDMGLLLHSWIFGFFCLSVSESRRFDVESELELEIHLVDSLFFFSWLRVVHFFYKEDESDIYTTTTTPTPNTDQKKYLSWSNSHVMQGEKILSAVPSPPVTVGYRSHLDPQWLSFYSKKLRCFLFRIRRFRKMALIAAALWSFIIACTTGGVVMPFFPLIRVNAKCLDVLQRVSIEKNSLETILLLSEICLDPTFAVHRGQICVLLLLVVSDSSTLDD